MTKRRAMGMATAAAALMVFGGGAGLASSHREAPGITKMPKVDSTDFYMFRSYEPGRQDYVTLIANYQPFEDPFGGPNYYTMDGDALYEIHIDNNGDAVEDITFQFDFTNGLVNNGTGITLDIGGKTLPIPLRHIGQVTEGADADLGENEIYSVTMITGDRRSGARASLTNAGDNGTSFLKPFDNVGNKTIPDYPAYARNFMFTVNIPGCATTGRVFVGQRAEGFAVNVGEIFDLVNLVPVEGQVEQSRENDDLVGKKNVTSIAMEVPIACLTGAGNGVIGAWQTASLPQARLLDPTPAYEATMLNGGAYVQVSRLSGPLVNEAVIGLPQKDLFNAAEPKGDAALADYVTNPTMPAILDVLFRDAVNGATGGSGTIAPTNFPRNDLVAAFLTGFATLNQQTTVTASEMMRLNTAIAPTPRATQSQFGVVGDDLAGFPNGRRPGDDVVDIELRVLMGRLCHPIPINGTATNLGVCQPSDAPSGMVPYTDGAPLNARDFLNRFPYLKDPIPGSPHEAREARKGG